MHAISKMEIRRGLFVVFLCSAIFLENVAAWEESDFPEGSAPQGSASQEPVPGTCTCNCNTYALGDNNGQTEGNIFNDLMKELQLLRSSCGAGSGPEGVPPGGSGESEPGPPSGGGEPGPPEGGGPSQGGEVCGDSRIDVVFVVDSSGSIRNGNPDDGSYDNWELVLDFVASVVEHLDIGDNGARIGLVVYSSDSKNEFFMNTYTDKEQIKSAIHGIDYMGDSTNTAGGLRRMHNEQFVTEKGDRGGIPNVAIVITDGASTVDVDSTVPEADAAKSKGIKVLVVGVTEGINESEVKAMSSSQIENDTYWKSSDFHELESIIEHITTQACTN